MTEIIPNLWGPLDVKVVSPVAVLRVQASKLTELTQGLLEGDVQTADVQDDVRHTFFVVAPALRRYRFALLEVIHGKENIYPASVKFPWDHTPAVFMPHSEGRSYSRAISERSAATTTDFVRLVGDALKSSYANATISSLIARINEAATANT